MYHRHMIYIFWIFNEFITERNVVAKVIGNNLNIEHIGYIAKTCKGDIFIPVIHWFHVLLLFIFFSSNIASFIDPNKVLGFWGCWYYLGNLWFYFISTCLSLSCVCYVSLVMLRGGGMQRWNKGSQKPNILVTLKTF